MKGIVIYKGKYGSTKLYAEWIGEKLNLPTISSDEINGKQLTKYDFLILGSAVYIGKLLLQKWIKKNLASLHNKKLFLFSVSATPPDKAEILQGYIESSVPSEIRNKMEIYFFPGRLRIKSLSWFDHFMLKMGSLLEKNTEAKAGMLKERDGMQKENLDELESSVSRFCKMPVCF